MRSSTLLLSYMRARRWRRAMLLLFFAMFVGTVLWAIPWVPYGLSVRDYNERLSFLILLMLTAVTAAVGAVYFRDTVARLEQTMATWTSLHEGLGDLRRREYFYDRLVSQCDLAGDRGEFTVVALRLEQPGQLAHEETSMAAALGALEPFVREQECLTTLGPHEIAVLAPRVSGLEAAAFAGRLRELIESATPNRDISVQAAWAVYPNDAEAAGDLVGVARKRLTAARAIPAATVQGEAQSSGRDDSDQSAVAS